MQSRDAYQWVFCLGACTAKWWRTRMLHRRYQCRFTIIEVVVLIDTDYDKNDKGSQRLLQLTLMVSLIINQHRR